MRLNKYQKKWINKLMSGTTRKALGTMAQNGGSKCCLGVAVCEVGIENLSFVDGHVDLWAFSKTESALKLKDDAGKFDISSLTKKGKEQLKKFGCVEKNDTLYGHYFAKEGNKIVSLAALNDHTKMSHVDIGRFINENRKAIFNS